MRKSGLWRGHHVKGKVALFSCLQYSQVVQHDLQHNWPNYKSCL